MGRLQKYPKIHVSTAEESAGSGTDSTQGLRPRHQRERNPERPQSNLQRDWPLLRPPERSLRSPSLVESTCHNSRKSRRFSPSGEKRPISAQASRGLSHLTSGTLKGSFTPLLHLKRFPDITVSSREEARVSHPHPEEPHFRLLAREVRSFPCVLGKEFPAFPSHLKKRRSPQERREELQGRATIP